MSAPFDPAAAFRVLAAHDVEYVLIGDLAAVIHGSSAMTNDADIVPASDAENLARLGRALRKLDARLRVATDPAGIPLDPHPALLASMKMMNLTTTCGDLDLTFEPAALDDYDALRSSSVVFELGGVEVHVASLDDVIRSKEAAGRAKDLATLPILHALREEIARSDHGG